MSIDRRINFSDYMHLAVLQQELSALKGWHKVTISPATAKATQAQFGYYYAVLIPIAKDWLNKTQGGAAEVNGEIIPYDDVSTDLWLKTALRGRPIHNPNTGEYLGTVAPMKRYWNVRTMVEFVDDVITELKRGGCRIPPPDKQWKEVRARALKEQQAA